MDGGCGEEETVPPQLEAKMKALCPDTHMITAVGKTAPLSPMGSSMFLDHEVPSVFLDHEAHLREDFWITTAQLSFPS